MKWVQGGRYSAAIRVAVLGGLLGLAACGGGGGGDNSTSINSTVNGVAVKGKLIGATVTAFDFKAGSKGSLLGTTTTATDGSYSLSLGNYSGPVLLELTVNASTQMTCDVPAGCNDGTTTIPFGTAYTPPSNLRLHTVLSNAHGQAQSAITPFTELATQLAQSNGGGAAAIESALAQVAALFDLPNLNATKPVDITSNNLGLDLDAQRYALMNAAIAQLAGSNLVSKLNQLATILTTNSGQLLRDGDTTNHLSLADILSAAQTVATAPAISSKLDPLVGTVVTNNLAAVAGQSGYTSVEPPSLAGGTDLAKAKAFVVSAHDVLQTLRGYGEPDALMTALNAKYANLTPFLQDGNESSDAVKNMVPAASIVMNFLAVKAAQAADDGIARTYGKADLSAYVLSAADDLSFDRISWTAGDDIQVTVDPVARIVTFNGTLTIQRMFNYWNCEQACYPVQQPIGTPTSFTVSNVAINFPSADSSQVSHAFSLLAQGAIQGGGVKLNLHNTGAASSFTINYATAATLRSRLNAEHELDFADPSKVPDSAVVSFNNITLALTNGTASFTGGLSFRADKTMLQVADPTSSDQVTTLLPTQLTFSGSFVGLGGDSVTATVTTTVDKSSVKPLVSPMKGHVRSGLFTYQYIPAAGADPEMATLQVNLTQKELTEGSESGSNYLWTWSTGGTGKRTFRLVAANSWACPDHPFEIQSRSANSYYGDYWDVVSCTSESSLTAALASTNWGRNVTMSNSWWYPQSFFFQVSTFGEGAYLPKVPNGFSYTSSLAQSMGGELIDSARNYSESATNYARAAISAIINTSISLDGKLISLQLKVDAHRMTQLGGEGTVTFTVGGKTLKLQAPVVGGVPAYTLSDMNGASVDIAYASGSTTPPVIKVNGQEMGRVLEIGGMPVVRFVDNSLIAL